MWIVKIALKAPCTFAVLAILLMIGGALSALQMPKDIFPAINIPVVGVIRTFNGMPGQEMERRITTVSRHLTTTVNNIEHLESNTFNGIGVIKVYLQPGANVDAAIAETTAACQAILKTLMDYGYATSKRAKFTHIKDKENEYNSCVIERAQKLWV